VFEVTFVVNPVVMIGWGDGIAVRKSYFKSKCQFFIQIEISIFHLKLMKFFFKALCKLK